MKPTRLGSLCLYCAEVNASDAHRKSTNKNDILYVSVRPIKAHIIAINRERLTAGRKVEAVCHTFGSRPSAVVKWFINDRQLTQSKYE